LLRLLGLVIWWCSKILMDKNHWKVDLLNLRPEHPPINQPLPRLKSRFIEISHGFPLHLPPIARNLVSTILEGFSKVDAKVTRNFVTAETQLNKKGVPAKEMVGNGIGSTESALGNEDGLNRCATYLPYRPVD